MKQIGSEEARRAFRDLLDEAMRGESTEIQRSGKLVAVLVPADWHRNALAVTRGVHAFIHDSDGHRLPDESQLPVGELMSAIGEAAISELEQL
jgi:prevent-host-death family protein